MITSITLIHNKKRTNNNLTICTHIQFATGQIKTLKHTPHTHIIHQSWLQIICGMHKWANVDNSEM